MNDNMTKKIFEISFSRLCIQIFAPNYLSIWRGQVSGSENGGATGGGCRGATLIQVRKIFSGGAFGRDLQATVSGRGAGYGRTGTV